mmetsp:Transcript_53499/g.100294  ORF Transcript_53499/g.100294 Transcript_53499/m.100294 type:complete len:205 (+) Transcript_53499:572-1186(+)
MNVCVMVVSVRSSFLTWIVFGLGTIDFASLATWSGQVAEKNRICSSLASILRMSRTCPPMPPALPWPSSSIWSASSMTSILNVFASMIRFLSQSCSFPGVPTTTCAVTYRGALSSLGTAKKNSRPVNLPNFSTTAWFWTESSRVGQRQSPCGTPWFRSTFASIARAKAAVFPEPFRAWPIMLLPFRAMGNARPWILDGLVKPIS